MEACIKILVICLPNGLTGAMHAPASGGDNDFEKHRVSELDLAMEEACNEMHAADLCSIYGDAMFAGCWTCLCTAHHTPSGQELTGDQMDESENMKAVGESVEWSHARVEALWKLLVSKCHQKLEVDSGRVIAEARVILLLEVFHLNSWLLHLILFSTFSLFVSLMLNMMSHCSFFVDL